MPPTRRTTERPPGKSASALWRLLSFLAPYRWRVVGAAGALVLAAGSVLAIGQGLRVVVDRGLRSGEAAMLDRTLMILLVVVAIMALASALRFYLVSWIGERVAADLRTAVFAHLLRLEPAFFEVNGVGELQSRVTTDTTLLETIIGSSFSVALRNGLLFVGALLMLFVTSPALTALVLAGIPLVVIPILIFGRRVRRLSRRSQSRIADVGSYAGETLQAIRTVQAFGHESADRRGFSNHVEAAFTTAVQRIRARAGLTGVVLLLVFTAIGIVLWRGGHAVLAGTMTPGQLSAFLFYAVLAASAVGAVTEVVGDLLRAMGAAERLLALLAAQPQITAPPRPVSLPEPARGALSLDEVCFAYPARPNAPALAGVTLDVAPGERLALVGPSGAGKSTLFALLLRFYDPQSGTIRFDGVDLRDADPSALRARLALVAQEPVLFTGSARDNIRYGAPEASEAALYAAIEAAHCLAFVQELPEGLATPLGPGGVQLSGGQRQRIAIARAILRDPALLLLDEATSSLDAESEQHVQKALAHLMAERTSIVIAHRLATVAAADRIAVIDRGQLQALGSHEELLAESALYARLAALQFDAPSRTGPTSPSNRRHRGIR